MTEATVPKLVLILGAARSGTTLLRALLDAHPEIGCPAEAALPRLIRQTRQAWSTICASVDPPSVAAIDDGSQQPGLGTGPSRGPQERALPEPVEAAIRESAQTIMNYYCRNGQMIYCDKSLDNAEHVGAARRSFPDTKCVVLVRHVMDTVLSGLEASPWGFSSFGYVEFVRDMPENTVAAIARYWEHQVSLALQVRDAHPDSAFLLRYEDLVDEPHASLRGVFDFLGVRSDLRVLDTAFAKFTTQSGPGDHKLAYTGSISAASIGRGKRVPVRRLPPPLMDRLSELAGELGYGPITQNWNFEPSLVDRTTEGERDAFGRLALSPEGKAWDAAIRTVGLVADNAPSLRWVVDFEAATIAFGDGDVELVIAGTAGDIALIASAPSDLADMFHNGRIRILGSLVMDVGEVRVGV